jgi:hypothetical protein
MDMDLNVLLSMKGPPLGQLFTGKTKETAGYSGEGKPNTTPKRAAASSRLRRRLDVFVGAACRRRD